MNTSAAFFVIRVVRPSSGKALSSQKLQDRKGTEGRVEEEGQRKMEKGRTWHQAICAAATSQEALAEGRWREGKHNQAHPEMV